MKTSGIFTRRSSGLDRKVWFAMVVTMLLSFMLVSYKLVTKNNEKACSNPLVFVNGLKENSVKTYLTGDVIWFKTPITSARKATWIFGDSARKEEGFTVAHTYTHEGIYLVSVITDGGCATYTKINVIARSFQPVDSAGNIIEHIVGTDQAPLGKYKFSTNDTAKSYKWTVENDNNYDPQFGRTGTFYFRTPKKYILKLVLNNDVNKTYRKEILVIDPNAGKVGNDDKSAKNEVPVIIPALAPKSDPLQSQIAPDTPKTVVAPPKVEVRHIIGTSTQTFKSYLQSFVCGGMEAKDFYKYLTDEGGTKVIANKAYTTFDAFCKDIKGKKIEIESVDFKKEGDRIIEINVGYDKKGKLARNPCKG
jgi:hypothetical protein